MCGVSFISKRFQNEIPHKIHWKSECVWFETGKRSNEWSGSASSGYKSDIHRKPPEKSSKEITSIRRFGYWIERKNIKNHQSCNSWRESRSRSLEQLTRCHQLTNGWHSQMMIIKSIRLAIPFRGRFYRPTSTGKFQSWMNLLYYVIRLELIRMKMQ